MAASGNVGNDLLAVCDCVVEAAESVLELIIEQFEVASEERVGDFIILGEQVLQHAILVEPYVNDGNIFVDAVREVVQYMMLTQESEASMSQRGRGRPQVEIGEHQLRYLIEQGFKIKDIAKIFGCSTRTIERRLVTFHISRTYSDISDSELDKLVSEINTLHPNCGEKSVSGRLRSSGYHIQRERVRSSLRRVDPSGVERRVRRVLHRRAYNVEAPNANLPHIAHPSRHQLWECEPDRDMLGK